MLETVSLMNEDIEEYEVTYDTDTYDIVDWKWKGAEHPIWTCGQVINGYSKEQGKGLMASYFGSRVWEPGSVSSDVLLAHFGLERYDLREVAKVTMGTNCLSSAFLWVRFESDKGLMWKDVVDIQNERWAGADDKCNSYYSAFVARNNGGSKCQLG